MWQLELNTEGGRLDSTNMSKTIKKANVSASLGGCKSFNIMEDKE